jgi:hypothetical protein
VHILRTAAGLLLPLMVMLAACDDPAGFRLDPIIVTDTVELAAPTASASALPSALDIISFPGQRLIGGGRFPERAEDAEQWDVAVRVKNGSLVLLPAAAAGLGSQSLARAAVTRPITGQSFEALREAPSRSSFVSDSAVALQPGSVYVVRSRDVSRCFQYAKLEPLQLDAAAGTVRLRVATNERCGDPRLVAE